MSKIAYFKASFDPITQSELDYAKSLIRNHGYQYVVFVLDEDGVLSKAERTDLIMKAIQPWRKFTMGSTDGETITYEHASADELLVRQGHFYLAAQGTKKTLIEQGYYLDVILDHWCKPSRAAHSREVAKVCRAIAHAHHLDETKAYRMGLLHDITKNLSDDQNEHIMKIYAPELLHYSPKVWHSFTAPIVLQQYLGVRDHVLLKAIWCHTLGDGMGVYDKILFVADKIEPTRGYDTSEQIALCMKDIHAGFMRVKNEQNAYLRKEGVHV